MAAVETKTLKLRDIKPLYSRRLDPKPRNPTEVPLHYKTEFFTVLPHPTRERFTGYLPVLEPFQQIHLEATRVAFNVERNVIHLDEFLGRKDFEWQLVDYVLVHRSLDYELMCEYVVRTLERAASFTVPDIRNVRTDASNCMSTRASIAEIQSWIEVHRRDKWCQTCLADPLCYAILATQHVRRWYNLAQLARLTPAILKIMDDQLGAQPFRMCFRSTFPPSVRSHAHLIDELAMDPRLDSEWSAQTQLPAIQLYRYVSANWPATTPPPSTGGDGDDEDDDDGGWQSPLVKQMQRDNIISVISADASVAVYPTFQWQVMRQLAAQLQCINTRRYHPTPSELLPAEQKEQSRPAESKSAIPTDDDYAEFENEQQPPEEEEDGEEEDPRTAILTRRYVRRTHDFDPVPIAGARKWTSAQQKVLARIAVSKTHVVLLAGGARSGKTTVMHALPAPVVLVGCSGVLAPGRLVGQPPRRSVLGKRKSPAGDLQQQPWDRELYQLTVDRVINSNGSPLWLPSAQTAVPPLGQHCSLVIDDAHLLDIGQLARLVNTLYHMLSIDTLVFTLDPCAPRRQGQSNQPILDLMKMQDTYRCIQLGGKRVGAGNGVVYSASLTDLQAKLYQQLTVAIFRAPTPPPQIYTTVIQPALQPARSLIDVVDMVRAGGCVSYAHWFPKFDKFKDVFGNGTDLCESTQMLATKAELVRAFMYSVWPEEKVAELAGDGVGRRFLCRTAHTLTRLRDDENEEEKKGEEEEETEAEEKSGIQTTDTLVRRWQRSTFDNDNNEHTITTTCFDHPAFKHFKLDNTEQPTSTVTWARQQAFAVTDCSSCYAPHSIFLMAKRSTLQELYMAVAHSDQTLSIYDGDKQIELACRKLPSAAISSFQNMWHLRLAR